jgi:hypothetical protein
MKYHVKKKGAVYIKSCPQKSKVTKAKTALKHWQETYVWAPYLTRVICVTIEQIVQPRLYDCSMVTQITPRLYDLLDGYADHS